MNAKSVELRRELDEVERQLNEVDTHVPDNRDLALDVFDFSQNLANIWRGSNYDRKRDILNCVSLNRTLSDTTLVMTKRKPFDWLAEKPFLRDTRGERIRTSGLLVPNQAL